MLGVGRKGRSIGFLTLLYNGVQSMHLDHAAQPPQRKYIFLFFNFILILRVMYAIITYIELRSWNQIALERRARIS